MHRPPQFLEEATPQQTFEFCSDSGRASSRKGFHGSDQVVRLCQSRGFLNQEQTLEGNPRLQDLSLRCHAPHVRKTHLSCCLALWRRRQLMFKLFGKCVALTRLWPRSLSLTRAGRCASYMFSMLEVWCIRDRVRVFGQRAFCNLKSVAATCFLPEKGNLSQRVVWAGPR